MFHYKHIDMIVEEQHIIEITYDLRENDTWDESKQKTTSTVCSYCGVGCNLELHVQDNKVFKVTSSEDHSVTNGHLCVKGRFGFQFIQNLKEK